MKFDKAIRLCYNNIMDESTYILMLFSKYTEQCYSDFLMSDNSFFESAKKVYKKIQSSSLGVKSFLQDILSVTLSNMLKMALVYQSEMFKNGSLNDALPDYKNLLNEIKAKVNEQNKTINNSQLYKLIREAFVHSTSENPNCIIVGNNQFKLKLKPKGQEEINLVLTTNDLLKIVTVFNLNIEKAMYYVTLKEDLQNAIDNHTLTTQNVGDYVSVLQYDKPVVFDEFQKDALLNYFYSNNEICKARYGFGSGYGEPLMSRIPFQTNPYNLYTDYMKVVYYLMQLSRNINLDLYGVEKFFFDFYMKNETPLREFITINPNVDISYNIILAAMANVATTVNKTELAKMFENAGIKIDENLANRIRNSFAHGRYFINNKKDACVEFYDGKSIDELSHILTLSIQDINKILVTQIFNYDASLTGDVNQKS